MKIPFVPKTKTPTRHFVVPFDINYLNRFIVCYRSLEKVHNNFVFHAFCFDDTTAIILRKMNLKHVKIYSPKEFETKKLVESKKNKVVAYEYYWSVKAFLVNKVLQENKIDMATYIDCDFMFLKSPENIFDEMSDANVLIQPNNFSFQQVREFGPVGYYCSCFESFKNNKVGLSVLKWWHARCMEWCFTKFEDDKFADQKYLEKWRSKFDGVREISTVGANIAPWNAQKYDYIKKQDGVYINGKYPLIYYHFHSFRMDLRNYKYIITGDRDNNYQIPRILVDLLYKPYAKMMKKALEDLKRIPEYKEYVDRLYTK